MFSNFGKQLDYLAGLFSAKKKNDEKPREVRMCVLGLDNAGKTTILRALSREEI